MKVEDIKNMAKKGGQVALVGAACVLVADYIIGTLNWSNIRDLPKNDPIEVISKNVGYFSNPELNSRCTAFVISENAIMTNKHCITRDYKKMQFKGSTFFTEYTGEGESLNPIKCEKLLAVSEGDFLQKDYAVFECESKFTNIPKLSEDTLEKGDEILHIHQNCDYFMERECKPFKVYENGGDCSVQSNGPSHVKHSQGTGRDIISKCDSLGGSSGSPYFIGGDKVQNIVIALHHVGVNRNQQEPGRGDYNRAVLMADIVPELKEKGIKINNDEVVPPKEEPMDKKWLANLRKFLSWLLEILSKENV